MVLVNPFGGTGRGKKLWEHKVKPMFDVSYVDATVAITEYAGMYRPLQMD